MGEPNIGNQYFLNIGGHSVNWNILVTLENKSNEIPLVATSEVGIVQTLHM